MKLPELSIKNYQFVLILIVMATFIGISSIMQMPRSEDPNPKFPFYTIVAVYPGTSPEDMEELIVNPLEDELDKLDDIDHIITVIEEGLTIIQVEATFGIDVDDKYDEIIREVKAIEPTLPDEMYDLQIRKFEPNKSVSIHQLALLSTERTFREMKDEAEAIQDEIEKLSGVNEVSILALPEEELEVRVDLDRMAAYFISMDQLQQVLVSQNVNIPGGTIKSDQNSFSVLASGSYSSLSDIEELVVAASDDHLVKLKDIATVNFAYKEDNWIGRYNGERAIFLTITQSDGNNIVQTGESINLTLDELRQQMPEDYELVSVFEQAPAVSNRISDFSNNLIQGVLLVGLIILLLLGWRPSVIIMMVIPLSIIIGIGLLDINGYALQQISIAALVIALGLLVDNGIVVVENIQRLIREGMSIKEAAVKGTSEVGFAIISSTATTLFAFLPLVFLNSGPGEFLRSLPLTVIFVLLISLVLAMTFTPLVAGRMLKKPKNEKPILVQGWISKLIERVYLPTLKFALKRGAVVLVGGVLLLFGSLSLFPSIGVSFFPTADKPLLLVEVETPRGSSLDRTDKAVRYAEGILDTMAFVSSYTSNVGHGNPTIYYNRVGENYKKYHGQLLINFEAWEPQTFYQSLEKLRLSFNEYPDARITFQELKNGPPVEAPIEIRLLSDDLGSMQLVSSEVELAITKTEGVIDVFNPLSNQKTDLKVAVDIDKAGMMAVPVIGMDQVIRAGVTGLLVDDLTLQQEEYDLVVKANLEEDRITELSRLQFASRTGQLVPFNHLAQLKFQSAIPEIRHYDTERSTSITASVLNLDQAVAVTENIIAKLDKIEWPEGVTYQVGGEYESQQESFGDLGLLLVLAMLGIFAILVLQFRSFAQPLIVFVSIPLAISGSFIALFLTGWSFSFFAFVGFISLVGIVVNNSIILVDYTNRLMESGMSKTEAIIQSSKTRFTPILLTTMTTILGLVPLTFQATNLWSPLGWTIIGGMISSTLLTLLLVPVLYQWFTRERTAQSVTA